MSDSDPEQVLRERLRIILDAFVGSLNSPTAMEPGLNVLSEEEARQRDDAHFANYRSALFAAGTEMATTAAGPSIAAFTVDHVARGLGISTSQVEQRRLMRKLWSLPSGPTWVFPALQFETDDSGSPTGQVRGFERVVAALPNDVHHDAADRFLQTPRSELFRGRPMTPVEWLRDGGDVDTVVAATAAVDWKTV